METDKMSSICIFCCKTVKTGEGFFPGIHNDEEEQIPKSSLPRFFQLFQRHLNIKKNLPKLLKTLEFDPVGNHKRQIDTCSLCTTIFTTFCDIYQQKEILNLQIQWKLQTLVRLMTLAGRVTSRIKNIKEMFGNEENANYQAFMNVRKEFIQMGSQKISRALPRVHVKKVNLLNNEVSNEPATVSRLKSSNSPLKVKSQEEDNGADRLQCWIMSLAAVVSLLSPFSKPAKVIVTDETVHTVKTFHDLFTEDIDETESELLLNAVEEITITTSVATTPEHCDPVCSTENNGLSEENGSDSETTVNSDDGYMDVEDSKTVVKICEPTSKNDETPLVQSVKAEICKQDQDSEMYSVVDIPYSDTISHLLAAPITTSEKQKQFKRKIFCKICSMSFLEYGQYLSHLKGTQHRRKMIRRNPHQTNLAKKARNQRQVVFEGDTLPNTTPVIVQSISTLPDNYTEVDNVEKRGYNLRSRKNKIPNKIKAAENEDESSSSSSECDSEFSVSDYSSSSSSSCSSTDEFKETLLPLKTEFCKQEPGYEMNSGPVDVPDKKHKVQMTGKGSKRISSVNKEKSSVSSLKKRFACPHCSQKYSRGTILRRHLKIRHPEKILKTTCKGKIFCKMCNKRFVEYRQYSHHVRSLEHRCKTLRKKLQLNKHSKRTVNRKETVRSTKIVKIDDETRRKDQQGRLYTCTRDGCNWKTRRQHTYRNHMQLHEYREFKCNFCYAVEKSAAKISMHEIGAHSKIVPIFKRTGIYQCPRCPYHCKTRLIYITHFTRAHLGIKEKRPNICSICHLKGRRGFHRRIHNTTGVDPSKIFRCSEEDCSVEFLCNRVLQRHKIEYHKVFPVGWRSSDEDDDDNDDNQNTDTKSPKCKFCGKTFSNESRLRKHKAYFHKKRKGEGEIAKSVQNYFICPNLKCHKSFKKREILDKHLQLHGSFKCQFCDVVKEYAPHLSMHELEHFPVNGKDSTANGFKCSRCGYFIKPASNAASLYTTHFLETHLNLTDKFYECSICKMSFRTANYRTTHFLSTHKTDGVDPKNIKRCTKCPAYFLLAIQLKKHQLQVCDQMESISTQKNNSGSGSLIPKLKHYCTFPECTENFKFLEELEAHTKLHAQFTCLSCDFVANYAVDLALHETEHADRTLENRKAYNCSRCAFNHTIKTFYVNHFLEKHLALDAKIYICVVCKVRFVLKGAVRDHFRKRHKTDGVDPSTIEKCDLCPAYFKKKIHLLQHKTKQHKGKESFDCLICDKTYTTRSKYLGHWRRMHKKISTSLSLAFPCDYPGCTKRFEREDDMIWHNRYGHFRPKPKTNEPKDEDKMATCDKCGKEFKGANGLKVHMNVHRENKPSRTTEYKCDKCSKVFKTKEVLQVHQEFHKDPTEWKFMCAVCSKMCVSKSTLNAHMNTHSKAKWFVCQICGEKYAHRHNLRNHVNTKHKDEGVEDIPRKINRRYFVSRKGKKLGTAFCFTRDGEGASGNNVENPESDDNDVNTD